VAGEKTLIEVFRNRVAASADRVALREKREGRWVDITWREVESWVDDLAVGFVELGLNRKEAVGIISTNRPEWMYLDHAVMAAGGFLVPVYPTLLADDVAYILNHCEARFVIVENTGQLDKVLKVRSELPRLERVILLDGDAGDDPFVMKLEQLAELGRAKRPDGLEEVKRRESEVGPDDIATIIYTSGTTGLPKGVLLSHSNILFSIHATDKVIDANEDDETVSYLPLAHALERVGGHFMGVYAGIITNYAESLDRLSENIREVRPTILLCVPRVIEKVYARIAAAVESSGLLKRMLVSWALGTGRRAMPYRMKGEPLPLLLKFRYSLARKLVYDKIAEVFGGRLRLLVSAGAPLSKSIAEFFGALGFTLIEGYGMTETAAPASLNLPDSFKFGSVGKPLPGVEMRIADDGEILIRAGNVFTGYFKNPEETEEALEGGWLHTGDVGYFDEDGFLFITDRKKDLIITAGGKNLAPQRIENMLKAEPYIQQAVVIGDRRPYLVALIVVDESQARDLLARKGIEPESYKDLVDDRLVVDTVQIVVDRVNSRLARFEQIKYFRILAHEMTVESGELTPTMKVKRNVVEELHGDLIDSMYAGKQIGEGQN